MTLSARPLFILAAVPLLLAGAMRPAVQADAGFTSFDTGAAKLELASLKAEARAITVHIDGP